MIKINSAHQLYIPSYFFVSTQICKRNRIYHSNNTVTNFSPNITSNTNTRPFTAIPAAHAAGFSGANAPFSFAATLLILPWVFFVVGYAQGSAQIGGEVKRASRSQYVAMVGGVLINGLVLAIIVLLTTHAVGTSWLRSVDYLAANDPAKLGLPAGFPPGVNFLAALLTHNVLLLALIGIGFVIWALMGTPLSELQASRSPVPKIDHIEEDVIDDRQDQYADRPVPECAP